MLLNWIFVLSVIVSVYGEINPYLEALKVRPWKSVQKYVEVRPGAFLFYWLYYADGTMEGAFEKPLVIWIQGGPGLAASGVANFAEIGPLNMNMEPRNHTWVNGRNLLLIDHPVGTGFSYALDESLYVKTDREAALDLVKAIKLFLRRHKQFRKTPTYIFGQSYGGKLVPILSYYLNNAIVNNRLQMNFKGLGIGSGWVNPKESYLVQPDLLYNMGVMDRDGYVTATDLVHRISNYINKKDYTQAERLTDPLLGVLYGEAGYYANFNNLNQPSPYPALAQLAVKINKYVKPTLGHVVDQNRNWDYKSDKVFSNLNKCFLIPSMKYIEILLNKTDLKIAVYNGNYDVVTPIAGAANWAHKLKWHGAEEFMTATKYEIRGSHNGFYKKAHNFSFWWVFESGHWVPEDNPEAMEQILNYVIKGTASSMPANHLFKLESGKIKAE